MLKKSMAVVALAATALALAQAPAAFAAQSTSTLYSTVPSTGIPGNTPSVGYEATSTSEFGDEINIGAVDSVSAVSVEMSSWACQQGTVGGLNCYSDPKARVTVPITLNIYGASTAGPNNTVLPGELLLRVTKKFALPYRPSAAAKCNKRGETGKWYSKADDTCYNGLATPISFNLSSLGVDLPPTVVIGIAYNTTHYGAHPIGQSAQCFGTTQGCFYDSLNVGTFPSVTTGSKPNPGTAFVNSSWSGAYCDATPATGVFNQDSPTSACWTGYEPAITVTGKPSNPVS